MTCNLMKLLFKFVSKKVEFASGPCSHLKVPHWLPEHGCEYGPYLRLEQLGRLVVGARVEKGEHVRKVAWVGYHKVQLQVELSADELKLEEMGCMITTMWEKLSFNRLALYFPQAPNFDITCKMHIVLI